MNTHVSAATRFTGFIATRHIARSVITLSTIALAAGGVWWNTRTARAARDAQSHEIGFAELAQRDTQIMVWNTALQADTGSALVLGQLAALHLQRAREGGGWDDYLTAEKLARHSVERRTNRNGASAVTLTNALLAQHRFTEARSVAGDLVKREGDIPEYRALLGEVAMEIGDDVVADSMFRSVWEQRTQLSMAPRIARWLELNNHVRDARVLLRRARDEAVARRNVATETKAWFELRVGDLELRAGNSDGAERAYLRGLQQEPGDPRLFAAMARVSTAKHQSRAAIAWGERAIGLQLDPATLGLLSDAYAAIGDTARANDYLRTLDVAVTSQPGAYHRAWALYLLDHGLRVDTVLSKAREELRDRRDVYGYDLVAWALFKSGQVIEAQRMMQQALRFNTPDPLLAQHAQAINGVTAHLSARE